MFKHSLTDCRSCGKRVNFFVDFNATFHIGGEPWQSVGKICQFIARDWWITAVFLQVRFQIWRFWFPKLEGIDYSKDNYGLPILNDCVAFIHCKVTNNYEVGDHTLVVGEVIEGSILTYEDPMSSIDTGWHYSG